MRVEMNRAGVVGVTDVPATIEPLLARWFGARRLRSHWVVPHRKLWALLGHWPQLEVAPQLREWLNEQFEHNAVFRRVSTHCKDYQTGWQARLLARAVARRHCMIAAGIGGGKTVLACEIARLVGPTLLLTTPWIWETAYADPTLGDDRKPMGDLARWYSRLQVVAAMGNRARELRAGTFRVAADVYAVSAYLLRSVVDDLLDVPFAAIIIDDVPMLEDPESEFSRAAERLYGSVPFRFVLNAELAPENCGQLWSVMHFVDRDVYGERAAFHKEYGERGRWGWEYPDPAKRQQALEKLHDSGACIMVPQETFWRPPTPPRFVRATFNLSPVERKAYDSMRDDLSLRIGDASVTASTGMTRTMKLRQLTSGFMYDDRRRVVPVVSEPAKLRLLREVLETPAPRGCKAQQAMVWCQFEEEYDLIVNMLTRRRIPWQLLRGGGRGRAGLEAIRAFAQRRTRVLVTHQKTAGHGLRFPRCPNAIFYSLDYQARPWREAIGRILRPPQLGDVTVWMLCAAETIDHDIADVLDGKGEWHDIVKRALRPPATIINVRRQA